MRIFESDTAAEVVDLRYAFSPSPFGEVLTACDDAGLCFAGFVVESRRLALADLSRRFPRARLHESADAAVDVFGTAESLHLVGTPFKRRVWLALLGVGRGETVSYSQLAALAGVPRAVRAAASAVASNPLSVIVPCHRVIRNDETLGQYFWGSELKRQLLEAERVKD